MQNGTLFHADIFSNIIISNPSLSEEDAWVAAEIANIADDVQVGIMKDTVELIVYKSFM